MSYNSQELDKRCSHRYLELNSVAFHFIMIKTRSRNLSLETNLSGSMKEEREKRTELWFSEEQDQQLQSLKNVTPCKSDWHTFGPRVECRTPYSGHVVSRAQRAGSDVMCPSLYGMFGTMTCPMFVSTQLLNGSVMDPLSVQVHSHLHLKLSTRERASQDAG